MSQRVGQELGEEFIRKAVVWTPPLAGGIILGPVGIAVGLAATVAVVCSGCLDDRSESDASQANETGSSK
jgi:hypothetical protein